METATIKRGDTLPYLVRPNTLAAGAPLDGAWSCRMAVYGPDGSELVAPTVVGETQTYDGSQYWVVIVTRAQSVSFPLGVCRLVIDVRNDALTPPYSQETPVEVVVQSQYIA